jgi:glycosyltransferase involved in cell wall biosynthesis
MLVMEPSLISHKAPSLSVIESAVDLASTNLMASQDQKPPVVCLGMPLYNQTEFLPAALNSILAQTYTHFQLVVVDDSTSSEPGEIIKQYSSLDNRIRYVKNPTRKGLVDNWKRCFELSENADYFAWVSDHDLWHPEFLGSLVEVMQSHPSVVLSYPLTVHIAPDDKKRNKKLVPPPLSTLGMSESDRVVTICRDTRYFGKMVYGLFRASALRSAGVFRRVLFPDVVLLFELCLTGDFVQIDKELRSQRDVAKFSIARQRRSLFVKKPWYIFLPWPFVNACVLFWQTVIFSSPGKTHNRVQGIKMSWMYLRRYIAVFGEGSWFGSYNELVKGKSPWIKKIRNGLKN